MWLKHSSVSLAVTLSLKTKWTLTVLPWVYFSLSPCWTHPYKWRSWWRAPGNTTTQPGPKGTKGGSQNWYLPPSDGAWGRPSPPHLQQRARLHDYTDINSFYFILLWLLDGFVRVTAALIKSFIFSAGHVTYLEFRNATLQVCQVGLLSDISS